MKNLDCDKYKNIDWCFQKYEDGTKEYIKCEYCHALESMYYFYNWFTDPFLRDWLYFVTAKYRCKNNIVNPNDIKLEKYLNELGNLKEALDLIWELLKEKKVKAQIYEIEEYEEPKEEEITFWTKFKKTIKKEFEYKISRLDPCTYKDNEKLEEDIENWKIETLALYKYVLEKYGQDEANFLFDILEIVRSKCHKWEIEIE